MGESDKNIWKTTTEPDYKEWTENMAEIASYERMLVRVKDGEAWEGNFSSLQACENNLKWTEEVVQLWLNSVWLLSIRV